MYIYGKEEKNILDPLNRFKTRKTYFGGLYDPYEKETLFSTGVLEPFHQRYREDYDFFNIRNRLSSESSFSHSTIYKPDIGSNKKSKLSVYQPCIIDSFGEPISKKENSPKIIITEINDQLLYELSQNPDLMYGLTPYNFECVIAKIFEKKGFSVKITPKTRDGGKDIFVAKHDLCSFMFYVECKKYSPDKPVGIDIIQRLYGVVSAEKATGGIIATTSYFTNPAKDYVQNHQLSHQLTLQDYDTISDILKSLPYKG